MTRRLISAALLLLAGVAVVPVRGSAGPAGAEPPYQLVETGGARAGGKVMPVMPDANLQAAVDAAQPGDTLVLQAGATYKGPITLPKKTGEGWIVIRSSAADELPAGRRVSPADAPKLARLVAGDGAMPAIRTAPGAHHFRLVGLEITVQPDTYNLGVVRFGTGSETSEDEFPHHLVVERCYVHGDPKSGGKRGIALNARAVAVVDSHISDWKSPGQETQALAGWTGPGPFKIVNNHIEAAGIGLLFGGGSDPKIKDLAPADIEIRRNLFTKPLAWRGEKLVVKNLLELKNARRVLIDGNVFEHSWAAAQAGFAILFSPRNQEGSAPWVGVQDVTFINNLVRGAGSGIAISGRDESQPSAQTRRIVIANNVFENIDGKAWGGQGRLFHVVRDTQDVTIEHNTAFATGAMIYGDPPANTGFVFRNNIVTHGEYGVKASGKDVGEPSLRVAFPNAHVDGNVIIGARGASYPRGNHLVGKLGDVGFVDPARGDWRLAPDSKYKGAGADVERVMRVARMAMGDRRAAAR
jgi:hypothetical protein